MEELNKIERLDLVLKILSDPDIKRLINRHPTTPLISRVTDDEEQSNTNGHLSLARKSRKCTCVCLLMMAIFLLVLVTLIAFEVAMTVSVAEVALKKQSDVEKIVAEGDSISLCNIDQMYINMIEISEAVRKGDSGHSIKIVLVPTDSLIFEFAYGLDYSNGSALVKDLPIINEIYVYLNKGSQMHFTVWIGNGNKAKSASLYIFNDADKLNDCISYGSVDSPVFTSKIPVEGKNINDITQKYGLHIGYYFLIPL